MLGVSLVLFAVLLVIGLRGGELNWDELGIFVTIWLALFLGCLALHVNLYWFWMAGFTTILDSILLFKVFGQNYRLWR